MAIGLCSSAGRGASPKGAIMDYSSFSEAMRKAAQGDKDAQPDVRRALEAASNALVKVGKTFQERSRRVERDLKRGAHLTNHRINL